jgi:hypothetical protein
MKKILFSILLLVLLSHSGWVQPQPPDTLWTHTYGGPLADLGYCVDVTTGGGFIIAGWTLNFGAQDWDALLIKTDPAGEPQWIRTYGQAGWDWAMSVKQTNDGGFIFTGETIPYGGGNTANLYLVKTDPNGNVIWSRDFGGPLDEEGRCVIQANDGGYLAVGWTGPGPEGTGDLVYLIKTDPNGNLIWSRTYGEGIGQKGECVEQTSDGGFIITGWTDSFGAGYRDVYLIKTDANGNMIWSKTFGGTVGDYGNYVKQTSDGGYIITGWSDSWGICSVYLIKTDANGDSLWTRLINDSPGGAMGKGLDINNQGYIITGSCGFNGVNVYIVQTDFSGNVLWTENYGGSQNDEGYSVKQINAQNSIICDWTYSYGAGNSDVYLIRLGTEIPPSPIEVTLTPHNPPIIIPAGGGSFQFDIAMTNNSQIPYILDAWTTITPPFGPEFSVLMRNDITLPAGWTMAKNNLTQFVPNTAPPGIYHYNAYLKDHNTWVLLAQDSFQFEKLTGDNAPLHNKGWACLGWDEQDISILTLPTKFALHPPSPNPFNPNTKLSYSLPINSEVKLVVFDIQGREVARIFEGYQQTGVYEATFDGSGLASGLYFASLQAGNLSQTQKLLLMK